MDSVAHNEEVEETIFYIAGHLKETQKKAIKQIRKIVSVLGCDLAMDYLKKSREIDRQGGMMVASGKRKRTVGGIFFYLVKTECDVDRVKQIWPDDKKNVVTEKTSIS